MAVCSDYSLVDNEFFFDRFDNLYEAKKDSNLRFAGTPGPSTRSSTSIVRESSIWPTRCASLHLGETSSQN